MSSRHAGRLLRVAAVVGFGYVSVVSCGGSDESKQAMEEGGGEGGEAPASSGGSKAGSGGSKAGSGGNAGSAGAPALDLGGAGQGPGPRGGSGGDEPNGGQAGSGEGGAPMSLGGAAGEASGGASGGGGASGEGGAPDACQAAAVGSRITIAFDALNAERVTNLQWLDSNSVTIANIAASGGPQTCGDPVEFFGESYGAPEGTSPHAVIAGSRSSAVSCGPDITITSAPTDCAAKAQIPVTTEYHFYGGAKASQMRVTRSIGFDANTPTYSGTGIRVWEPRMSLATFSSVIYPNAAETAVTSKTTQSCPGDCLIPVGATWSGRWFADIAASGLALIVLRDASMTAPVDMTINYDSYSSANIASFVVLQPQGGWKAPVTEVQYVCFADLTSWPQTERDAAKLPAWCGP